MIVVDILTAILALLFGADTPHTGQGMDNHATPECFNAPAYVVTECTFTGRTETDFPGHAYYISTDGTIVRTYPV